MQSNAATQATAIIDLTANAATQATAIVDLQSNAATQATSIDTLFSNAATQATAIDTLTANAATQATAIASLAPLSQPSFVSNLNVTTGANFFVAHNTLSTFGANVDIGSSDGSVANLIVRNGSSATFITNVEIGNAEGTATNLIMRNGSVSNFGDLVNFFGNIVVKSNLLLSDTAAKITLPSNVEIGAEDGLAAANLTVRNGAFATFGSNIDIGGVAGYEANLTVRNGSRATFSSNLEIGTVDGIAANITVRNGSYLTAGNIEIGSVDGTAGNITVRNGSHATFTTNVTVVPGSNVHIPEGVEFSVFGGNAAVYKSTRIAQYPWPSTSVGSSTDRAGMLAFDTNTNTLLICVANYDGATNIWANIAGPAGPGLPTW